MDTFGFIAPINLFVKMYSTNNLEASDAELPGPGSSVTDLSVRQGTSVDDPDLDKDNEKHASISILVPLGEGVTACPLCSEKNLALSFLSVGDLALHLAVHHILSTISWKCKQCERCFDRLHGWRCHFPKCRGLEDSSQHAFKCEACAESFDSLIGLSMHERHRHPSLRNRKRMAQAEKPKKPPGRKANLWTQQEIELLKELEKQHCKLRFPNVEIQKSFPGKTIDQVRHKRHDLSRMKASVSNDNDSNEDMAESASNTENVPDGLEEQLAEGASETDPMEMEPMQNDGAVEWFAEVSKAVEDGSNATMQRDMQCLNEELTNIWNECIQHVEVNARINQFITSSLVPFLVQKSKENADRNETKNVCVQNRNNMENRSKKKKLRNRTAKRKYEYARSQEMYKHCPKKLAAMVLKGDFSMITPPQPPPSSQDVEQLYRSLWEIEGPPGVENSGSSQITQAKLSDVLPPFTVLEVEERIKKTRSKSAAGPDGIRKMHLCQQGIGVILSRLYNILLCTSCYPDCWKVNRTTLIPKAGKNLDEIKNWRPITIGSLIGRIFSSLLDRRLRRVIDQNVRQKGFTMESGCAQNVILLAEAIQRGKVTKGGIVSVLDINKAFDTLPHSAIKNALHRKGIPEQVSRYVCEMYKNCSTVIRARDSQVRVNLRRGVKQGDPLSPLIFNLCIEKLLETIENTTIGMEVSNNRAVSILGFADDLVLLGAGLAEAKQQLQTAVSSLEGLGMSLSASKCSTFQIITTKDSWYIKEPNICINDHKIPAVDPEEIFTYLGAKFGPWKGLHKGQVVPDVVTALRRLRTLSLKPYQKIELFTAYILPHFIYSLLISPPSEATLKLLDSEIRQHVKEILHLVPSTATGFFYSPRNSGGLGIPRLEHVIKLGILRNGIKILSSSDLAVREVIEHENTNNKLEQIARSLRINWPATIDDIKKAKHRLKMEHLGTWSALNSQGQGVQDYQNNKIGNYWLRNPWVLKASRYTDALRLRTNTFGTRVVLARTKKDIDIRCRRCRAQPETLGHVLGLCIHTKPHRIKRHDDIKNMIAERVALKDKVVLEPTLRANGCLYKPDLIVKNEDKAIIVDVTVRFENRDYLKQAYQEKVNKYEVCLKEAQNVLGCSSGSVLPIVVGSRGIMPQYTINNLKVLGIKQKDILTIALNTLRSSIEMANMFIDYD